MRHLTITRLLVLAAAASAGCSSSPSTLNTELAMGTGADQFREGQTFRPPTLQPALAATAERPDSSPVEVPERSVVSLSRDNWEIMPLSVPTDRLEHQPIYHRSQVQNDELARNRGQYPTARTANDTISPSTADSEFLEMFTAPLYAIGDIVLFLPRAWETPPWATTRTGFEPYRREPAPTASVPWLKTQPRRTEIADPAAAPVQIPEGEYPPLDPLP